MGRHIVVHNYLPKRKPAHDADYKSLNAWRAATLTKYPAAVVKWNGDRTYTATWEGKQVGRFDYGDIKSGDLGRGIGTVDKTRDAVLASGEQFRYDYLMGRYQRGEQLSESDTAELKGLILKKRAKDATNYEKMGFTYTELMEESLGYLNEKLSLAKGDLRSAKEDGDAREVTSIERFIAMLEKIIAKKRGNDSAVVPARLSGRPPA